MYLVTSCPQAAPSSYQPALRWLLLLAYLSVCLLGGCSTITPKTQNLTSKFKNQRASILTSSQLSQVTKNTLAKLEQNQRSCLADLPRCLSDIAAVPELNQAQVHSSLAELYLAAAEDTYNSAPCKTKPKNQPIQKHLVNALFKSQVINHNKSKNVSAQNLTQTYTKDVAKARAECIASYELALTQSIRFSYAYLFLGEQSAQSRVFSDRQVQVRDFYNQAVNELIASVYARLKDAKPKRAHFLVKDTRFDIILDKEEDLTRLKNIKSAYNLSFSGLTSQSIREGFGVSHVAEYDSLNNTKLSTNELQLKLANWFLPDKSINQSTAEDVLSSAPDDALKKEGANKGVPATHNFKADATQDGMQSQTSKIFAKKNQLASIQKRIHEARFLPRTIVIEPNGDTLKAVLATKRFVIRVLSPFTTENLYIQKHRYPLAANFSAPYGLWLSDSSYQSLGYISFFAGLEELSLPHLYMLEPYDPNKRVIVMLHGLAASPESWIDLTNELFADPVLRDNFQVWQVFYSTSIPMIENRHDIYNLLRVAFEQYHKVHEARASNHAVFIGHSMGGVIGRMLLSDDDLTQSVLAELAPIDQVWLKNHPEFLSRFDLDALKPFDRAVFLSAPFRGTPFADRWFTTALRKIARLPSAFVGEINNTLTQLTGSEEELAGFKSLFLENAATQLRDSSRFMQLTKSVMVNPKITTHTIIGKADDLALTESSDGIVPYTSSHLQSAASEKVIKGGHSIQHKPAAVIELKRILRLHLHEVDGVDLPKTKIDKKNIETARKYGENAN